MGRGAGQGAGQGSRQNEGYLKRQLRHGPLHAVRVGGLKLEGKSTGGWTDREVLVWIVSRNCQMVPSRR